MALRDKLTDQLKDAMRGRDAAKVSTLRMILARLKDTDIAARPKGVAAVPDDEIVTMLRAMAKSRRESVELYLQGRRPELAAKEQAEIEIIASFLPTQLDEAAIEQAVAQAVAETGATTIKDMGKVMAALKSRHGDALDMARAGPIVRARLAS